MLTISNWSWKPQPDYKRLRAALMREGSPTFVPFLELFADAEFMAAALEEPTIHFERDQWDIDAEKALLDQKMRFYHLLGYDALWQGVYLPLTGLIHIQAGDTALHSRKTRHWINEKAGVITNWEDFENYPWPRTTDADYSIMEHAINNLPEGMGIIAAIKGMMEPLMFLMGLETLSFALYDVPDLVQAICDKISEIYTPIAKALISMDRVFVLWMADDLGYKTGTLIAPDHLREFVFPYQKRISDLAHDKGFPFLIHACGNLTAVMDDLIDFVRIDAKHSFEDVIEPVGTFLNRYGDKVAAIGGVDIDILSRGSTAQVRRQTRKILEQCAPSKAYILGSGNSVTNYIPVPNFLSMIDEGWHFNSGN